MVPCWRRRGDEPPAGRRTRPSMFGRRTLEPDTIPFLALVASMTLHAKKTVPTCHECRQPTGRGPRTRICQSCKKRGAASRNARYHERQGRVKRHIRYLTCRRCGQVDNIACPACRERMQQRKHKQGLRDALRAAGLTSSHDPEYSRRYHLL